MPTRCYIAIGILGATVMPHNLYLHSSLVQTRKIGKDREDIRSAIRLNTLDSAVSLNLAFFVNAAILVVAAAVFYRNGYYNVAEIQDAQRLLQPVLGVAIAPIAFAVGLLASGQSSTITGTLAGQIVMEGYLNWRIRPWLRRVITRLLAVVPAIFVILRSGEGSVTALLVLSQVILSLQLPFAIVPLIHAVADKRRMGEFAVGKWIQGLAWVVAIVIVGLNIKLIVDQIAIWVQEAGDRAWILQVTILPIVGVLALLLLFITVQPWLRERIGPMGWPKPGTWPRISGVHREPATTQMALTRPSPYRRVAIAVDFSGNEEKLLSESLRFIDKSRTKLFLMHVVESPVGRSLGNEGEDLETIADRDRLEALAQSMKNAGISTQWRLSSGDPSAELAKMINDLDVDVVIVGSHGHAGVSDLIHGAVIGNLRHRIKAGMMIVPLGT